MGQNMIIEGSSRVGLIGESAMALSELKSVVTSPGVTFVDGSVTAGIA
jgi:hypothetical protein